MDLIPSITVVGLKGWTLPPPPSCSSDNAGETAIGTVPSFGVWGWRAGRLVPSWTEVVLSSISQSFYSIGSVGCSDTTAGSYGSFTSSTGYVASSAGVPDRSSSSTARTKCLTLDKTSVSLWSEWSYPSARKDRRLAVRRVSLPLVPPTGDSRLGSSGTSAGRGVTLTGTGPDVRDRVVVSVADVGSIGGAWWVEGDVKSS